VRVLSFLVIFAAGALLLFGLGRTDIRGGEEARHAVMARNVAEHPAQLLNASPEPAGPPGATPFLYPALTGLFLRLPLRPEAALRLPSALAVLGAGLALLSLASARTRLAGITALGVFALNPLAVLAGRLATPDALAAALALGGFWAAVRAARGTPHPNLGLAGVALGLSFLCRPWACLPVLAGALLAVAAGGRGRRAHRLRLALVPLALFAAAAGSHWVLVSLLSPSTDAHWLAALVAPLTGAAPPSAWPAAAQRQLWVALAPALPLVALGVLAYLREPPEPLRLGALAWLLCATLARRGAPDGPGALLLLPCWALLAAAGAEELCRWSTEEQWRYPPAARAMLALLPLAAAAALAPASAAAVRPLGGPALAAAVLLVWTALVWLIAGRYAAPPLKLGLVAAGLCLVLAWQAALSLPALHRAEVRNGYRDLGALLESPIQGAALDATAFLAPDPEALAFYLFRRGAAWQDRGRPLAWEAFLRLADGRHARAFVVPRDPRRPPDPRVRAWLALNTTEIGAALPQARSAPPPWRAYVTGGPQLPQLGPPRPPGVPERKAIIHPAPPPHRYRRL